MKANLPRWTIAFAGAVALHGAVLAMVPWSKSVALSERSAGEESDIWGSPTNTVVMELATVEQVSGEETEVVKDITEAKVVAVPQPKPVKHVEPKPEPKKVAEAAPEKPKKKKVDQAQKSTKNQVARGNSQVSVSAASGVAQGNRGLRKADAGWADRSNYAGKIVAHLQRYKSYPREAANKRLTGIATLTFSISADGRVKSVKLQGSSGAPILDQAALATVQRASPFPAIPAEAGVSTMTFTVPLRYRQQ
jgi:protein TonB